ncbi:MAG: hypothetical protein NXY57DRAFT_960369 [Lentinula lateritia]|nr:MAG: hypothetical protein NXY57DRAFT_960369 [Lentinula lateritia]
MLFLEEFEAWVTIDGRHAEEYQWQYIPKQNLVQCWIASEVGKPFQIHWLDSKRSTATDGFVLLDGKKCGGSVISYDLNKPNYTCKEYIRTGPTTVKPFEFSQTSLTDDDTRADPDLLTTELGQIELLIVRVRVKSYETPQTRCASKQQLLHEKAKKGIHHQTTFGKTVASSSPRQAVRLEQLSDDAVARFRFLYRPIDMLKAKGIAPSEKPRAKTTTGPESKSHVMAGTRFFVKAEDALSKYTINSAPSRGIPVSDWDTLLPSSDVDTMPEAQDEMGVIKVQGSASSVPGPSSLPGLVSLPEGLRSTLGPGSFVPSTGYISNSAGLELPSLSGFFKCDDDGLEEQNMTKTEILAPNDHELETVVVHQNLLQGTARDENCEPSVQSCTVVSTAGMTAMNPIVIADDDNDGVKTENSNDSSIRAASSFSLATLATSPPVSPSPFPSDRAPMIDTRPPVTSALELLGRCKKRRRSSTPSTIHVPQQKWRKAESNPLNDTQEVNADDTRHSTTSVSTEPQQAPKIVIVKSDDGALDSTQITDVDDEEDRMLASEMETLQVCNLCFPSLF